MNKNIFYIASLLGTLLMTVVSCEKEDVVIPTPESNCTSCPCIDFDGTGLNESFSSTTYSNAFYFQSGVTIQGKYTDYSGLGRTGAAETILASGLPHPNFSGDVLDLKDADVLFDYSNANHPTKLKYISFHLNDSFSTTNLKVNGGSPQAYIKYGSPSKMELVGNINTIELGGENLQIDNMCLNDFIPNGNNIIDSSLITFTDTIHHYVYAPLTPTDVNYTLVHQEEVRLSSRSHLPYPANTNQIDFRIKYVNYLGSNLGGYMLWGAHNYIGIDYNSNFHGGLLVLYNCDVEADLSSLGTGNKHVSFDISNDWTVTNPNEFEVNGAPLSTIPAGVSYYLIPLGNAANGSPCYRVVIEGPINTFVLKGGRTHYDNLYISDL